MLRSVCRVVLCRVVSCRIVSLLTTIVSTMLPFCFLFAYWRSIGGWITHAFDAKYETIRHDSIRHDTTEERSITKTSAIVVVVVVSSADQHHHRCQTFAGRGPLWRRLGNWGCVSGPRRVSCGNRSHLRLVRLVAVFLARIVPWLV